MLSIWEKQSFLKYDYIVIGGGIVGLSTAISIKEKNKKASVLILERGIFPTGASTKNAGFACFGSFTELLADIENMGEETALQIVKDRWKGLRKLRERLGDKNIQYLNYGGFELLANDEIECLNHLDRVNRLLMPIFKTAVFLENKQLINDFGFNNAKVKTIIQNPFEGQLDTGKMMKKLAQMASSLGIEVITGAEAAGFVSSGKKVAVTINHSLLNTNIAFEASGLAICTNAFSKKLLPDIDLSPGRGLILVTNPLPNLKFKGAFHFQEGYFYFRNYENRILFGGGRNSDLENEATTDFLVNEKILKVLHQYLQEMIIPGQPYKIDHLWTGIMAFGKTKEPYIAKVDGNVVVGVRLAGMGVAIGTMVGERVADMLLN